MLRPPSFKERLAISVVINIALVYLVITQKTNEFYINHEKSNHGRYSVYETSNNQTFAPRAVQGSSRISAPHTGTALPNQSDPWDEAVTWRKGQEQRRTNLTRTCEDVSNRELPAITKEGFEKSLFQKAMLVDKKHGVVYCSVPKVACTSWKAAMTKLSGKPEAYDKSFVRDIHNSRVLEFFGLRRLSDYKTPSVRDVILQNYTKFMTVRHPFERLLSAYINKFRTYNVFTEYFQNKYGRQIIKKYRDKPTAKSLKNGHDVKFREFVRYLLDEDFPVSFRLNPHWTPFSILCRPCEMNYDYIVRYETISEDSTNILHDVYGVQNTNGFFPWRTASKSSTKDHLSDYYDTIDPETMEKLYRLFEKDFLLFNYTSYSFNKSS